MNNFGWTDHKVSRPRITCLLSASALLTLPAWDTQSAGSNSVTVKVKVAVTAKWRRARVHDQGVDASWTDAAALACEIARSPSFKRSMAAAYAVELDSHTARHYADKGATVLFLDVPEATHIAFDHQASLCMALLCLLRNKRSRRSVTCRVLLLAPSSKGSRCCLLGLTWSHTMLQAALGISLRLSASLLTWRLAKC